MTYTRPQGVPDSATLIYPDQQFPPGQGVQAATLRSIAAQNAAANSRTELNYQRALADWQMNKSQAEAYGLRLPIEPFQPPKIVDRVLYGKPDGSIVDPPAGADGSHGAWAWEVYE